MTDPIVLTKGAVAANGASDSDRVAEVCRLAIRSGRELILDASSNPFRLTKQLEICPLDGQTQARVRMRSIRKSSAHPTFEYSGPAGPAVTVLGLKRSVLDDILVRSFTPGASGWFFGTDVRFQSHSGGIYSMLGFEAAADAEAGFLVGDDTRKGAGHADMSCCTFSRCYVVGTGRTKDALWEFGGNTCNIRHDGFMAYGTTRSIVHVEGHPTYNRLFNSGGTSFANPDIGQAPIGFLVAGGAHLSIVGGRSEKISGPVIHTLAGGGPGWVKTLGFYADGVDMESEAFAKVAGQTIVTH